MLAPFLSAFELAFEQFVHLLRVGLALGGFHGLADEEAEHFAAFGFVCRAVSVSYTHLTLPTIYSV